MEVVNTNSNQTNFNVFLIGHNCDKGVKAKGGRSGSETGPEFFRKMFFTE